MPLRDDANRREPWLPPAGVAVSVEEAVRIAWRWHLYRHGGPALDRELPGYHGFIRTTSGAFLRFLFLTRVDAVGADGMPLPGRYRHVMTVDSGGEYGGIVFFANSPRTASLPSGLGTGQGELSFGEGADTIPIVFARQPFPEALLKAGGGAGVGYIAAPGEQGSPTARDDVVPPDDEPSALDVADIPRSDTGTRRAWPGAPEALRAPLVCRSYLVEPKLSDLVDTRNLVGRMRALAAALAIPECGYAGMFALHCATAISGRARGVAAASIASGATTEVTVRPDATGNNGFVHLTPSPTPELHWLRRLAGLAREVDIFAGDVVSTYLDAANARLVGIADGDPPNAAGWAIRFIGDLADALRFGYENVFAETCRSIMLQQLRSSRAGITARQRKQNFDALVEDIGSKIEKLGDLVLWPTVLLRAIEYAGSVGRSAGTVREILSIHRVRRTRDDYYELPAPIESTPRRILDLVGDDRVEERGGERVAVHDGRAWTADQLRETINQRRRLLNMSDPLFYQVPDLQTIAFRRELDRGYLERYLRTLLADMLAANERMTGEATDLQDGAHFALAASKYAEREGGRDWRGLRYTLQGIHQLADDVLAPEVHGLRLYAAGVDQAIDHKAARDKLLQFASTFGIILLGLFCAPLGAVAAAAITGAVSIGFAVHDVLDAQRETDLYHALEDPELFQHWQDVQLDQLMAAISVAFSVFDAAAVGKGARTLTSAALEGLRVAEKQGARTAVRLAAAEVRERVLKGLTEEMIQHAVRQAVHEAAVVAVMNELLPHVITPVLVPWIRRQAQEHGTAAEVDAALGPLATGGTP